VQLFCKSQHDGNFAMHSLEVEGGCLVIKDLGGHTHGPDCGHEMAPHGDHLDYLVQISTTFTFSCARKDGEFVSMFYANRLGMSCTMSSHGMLLAAYTVAWGCCLLRLLSITAGSLSYATGAALSFQ